MREKINKKTVGSLIHFTFILGLLAVPTTRQMLCYFCTHPHVFKRFYVFSTKPKENFFDVLKYNTYVLGYKLRYSSRWDT